MSNGRKPTYDELNAELSKEYLTIEHKKRNLKDLEALTMRSCNNICADFLRSYYRKAMIAGISIHPHLERGYFLRLWDQLPAEVTQHMIASHGSGDPDYYVDKPWNTLVADVLNACVSLRKYSAGSSANDSTQANQGERKRERPKSLDHNSAMQDDKSELKCYGCGRKGHIHTDCFFNKKGKNYRSDLPVPATYKPPSKWSQNKSESTTSDGSNKKGGQQNTKGGKAATKTKEAESVKKIVKNQSKEFTKQLKALSDSFSAACSSMTTKVNEGAPTSSGNEQG